MRRIVILHTNDLHDHLRPESAEAIRKLKDEAQTDSLLLDAGDAISAGNIDVRLGGEPILQTMTALGYDAMTMGNREFHFLRAGMRSKLSCAGFPVLCANLRAARERSLRTAEGGDEGLLPSHIVRELDCGVRIGVMGLSVPMITGRMLARLVSNYVFDDPVETARKIAPEIRPQVDLLVALTHLGLNLDRRLALEVPEIDLIVGGHSHDVLEEPEMIGRTAIVHAGWYGHYVGRVEIELAEGEPPRVIGRVISLGGN